MKHLFVLTIFFGISAIFSITAMADSYSCAKMVYKDGWLKKYEYKGNTWGANTKKHGLLSSTGGSSTETSTAAFDPGVSTGNFMSSVQYSSSWGECSMMEMLITRQNRENYIDQNLNDIKKHVSLGGGHHIDSLAFLSGCTNLSESEWKRTLQESTAEFYDSQTARDFVEHLESLINQNPSFSSNCQTLS